MIARLGIQSSFTPAALLKPNAAPLCSPPRSQLVHLTSNLFSILPPTAMSVLTNMPKISTRWSICPGSSKPSPQSWVAPASCTEQPHYSAILHERNTASSPYPSPAHLSSPYTSIDTGLRMLRIQTYRKKFLGLPPQFTFYITLPTYEALRPALHQPSVCRGEYRANYRGSSEQRNKLQKRQMRAVGRPHKIRWSEDQFTGRSS